MTNPGGIRSIAWRAALALALMFGFYGLALDMVLGLAGLPILAFSYAKGVASRSRSSAAWERPRSYGLAGGPAVPRGYLRQFVHPLRKGAS